MQSLNQFVCDLPCLPTNCSNIDVWVSAHYDGIAKQLLGALKLDRPRAAAALVANQVTDELSLTPDDILVIPNTAATSRARQMGYDQSQILAKVLLRIIDRK